MRHVPVLLNEVIEGLNLEPGSNVIDCTLGDAGHSEKILELTAPDGKLLGIDADPEAILRAKQYLYNFNERVVFVRDNFENLKKIVEEKDFKKNVGGILMDFGWSSPQFAERGRGFSFQNNNEPLDMRYGSNFQFSIFNFQNPSSADLVNNLNSEELEKIFREYGEENLSKEISEAIIEKRKSTQGGSVPVGEIKTVGDLVEIILQTYRTKLKIPTQGSGQAEQKIPWVGGLHPATKVFQALRIAVNDEFGVIERVLPQAIEILKSGGRLAVITFHSTEDRIVKHYFKSQVGKTIEFVNKKPITCGEKEYEENPRARSAKLRVVQKI